MWTLGKWKLSVLGLIVIVIIGIAFYFTNNDKASLASKDVFIDKLQKDLIKNSKAVVYYSTTIDAPTKNSLALFISNDNKVQALKMDGLELGSTTYNDDQKTLLVEDKNSLKFITDAGITTQTFKQNEHTGTKTGYLSKGRTFYSLYNTGVLKDNGYESTIRYGNTEKTNQLSVSEWAREATDNGVDTIYAMVEYYPSANEGAAFRLVQAKLDKHNSLKEKKISELSAISNLENSNFISGLHYKDHHIYSIFSNTGEDEDAPNYYELLDYDLAQKKLTRKPLPQYENSYIVADDSLMIGDNIYYAEREGDVARLNVQTGKTKTLYNLFDLSGYTDAAEEGNHLVRITDDKTYFIYPKKNGNYYLDTFDLKTGKKLSSDALENMKEILAANDTVFPYDLEIID